MSLNNYGVWLGGVTRTNRKDGWLSIIGQLPDENIGSPSVPKPPQADANPYLPQYAEYFWYRRNKKGSKLLAAMSARELRAMKAA